MFVFNFAPLSLRTAVADTFLKKVKYTVIKPHCTTVCKHYILTVKT